MTSDNVLCGFTSDSTDLLKSSPIKALRGFFSDFTNHKMVLRISGVILWRKAPQNPQPTLITKPCNKIEPRRFVACEKQRLFAAMCGSLLMVAYPPWDTSNENLLDFT